MIVSIRGCISAWRGQPGDIKARGENVQEERRKWSLVTEGCLPELKTGNLIHWPTEQTVVPPRCHPCPDSIWVSDQDVHPVIHSVIHSIYDTECPRMQRSFLSEGFLPAHRRTLTFAYVFRLQDVCHDELPVCLRRHGGRAALSVSVLGPPPGPQWKSLYR